MFGARDLVGALLFSLVAVAACGSSSPSATHAVAAKNYPGNCASVADCFAVYEGPVGCCGGGCPNAEHCTVQPPCLPQGGACATGRVACVSGLCQLEAPDANAAD